MFSQKGEVGRRRRRKLLWNRTDGVVHTTDHTIRRAEKGPRTCRRRECRRRRRRRRRIPRRRKEEWDGEAKEIVPGRRRRRGRRDGGGKDAAAALVLSSRDGETFDNMLDFCKWSPLHVLDLSLAKSIDALESGECYTSFPYYELLLPLSLSPLHHSLLLLRFV